MLAGFPEEMAERWSEPLRAALAGLAWTPDEPEHEFEGPGFRFRPPPGFARTTNAFGSYAFAPADRARTDRLDALEPSLSVLVNATELDPSALETEARARLEARAGTSDWTYERSIAVTRSGIPGWEILAHALQAVDEGRKEPFFTLATLVHADGITWWLHGEARTEFEPAYRPLFETSVRGFERVQPAALSEAGGGRAR